MAPSTRASRRDTTNRETLTRHVSPDKYGDSSSDESIPPSRPSPHRSHSNDVATLRPRNTRSQPPRTGAALGGRGQTSNKRGADGSPVTPERPAKLRRRDPLGIAGMSGGGDEGNVGHDAGVNQAALDAINAFTRKRRRAGPVQRWGIEVHIPSSKSNSGLGSDWNPEKQLQRETAAQQQLYTAKVAKESIIAAHPGEALDNDSDYDTGRAEADDIGDKSEDEEEHDEQISESQDEWTQNEQGGESKDEGLHGEQGRDSEPNGYREQHTTGDAGSPELDSHSPYRPSALTMSRQHAPRPGVPLPGIRETEDMVYSVRSDDENTLRAVALTKPQRKGKKRVVKAAYNERTIPGTQKAYIPTSAQPRTPRAGRPATEAWQAPPAQHPAAEVQQSPRIQHPAAEAQKSPRARRPASEVHQSPGTRRPASEVHQSPGARHPAAEVQQTPRSTLRQVPVQTSPMSHIPVEQNGNQYSSAHTGAPRSSQVPDPRSALQAEHDGNGQAPVEEQLEEIQPGEILPGAGRAVGGPQLAVTLGSKLLLSMRRLLASSGWTGLGWDWIFELTNPKLYAKSSNDAPLRTKLGRSCWKFLFYLQSTFNDAPKAPEFAEQSKWLDGKRSQIDKTMRSIDTMIKKISEDYLAVLGDSDHLANNSTERRLAMVKDLVEFLIPLLVSVLHTMFLLGGVDWEEDGKPALLDEGAFTIATLDCLTEVVGWIVRLERVLTEELQQRPLDPVSDEESSDGEGGKYKKAKDGRQKAKDTLRKQRFRLGKYIAQFRHNVMAAYDKLEATAMKEERRQQAIAREKDIKEAMLRDEAAAEEERERRWQAMCQSTQRMKHVPIRVSKKQREVQWPSAADEERDRQWQAMCQSTQLMKHAPAPLSEKWRKAQQLRATPLTPEKRAVPQHVARRVDARTAAAAAAASPGAAARSGREPEKGRRRWPMWAAEDSRWVLEQLRSSRRRPDLRALAEALQRDVEDVRGEVEMLKQSWRSLAAERGVEVEAWARARE